MGSAQRVGARRIVLFIVGCKSRRLRWRPSPRSWTRGLPPRSTAATAAAIEAATAEQQQGRQLQWPSGSSECSDKDERRKSGGGESGSRYADSRQLNSPQPGSPQEQLGWAGLHLPRYAACVSYAACVTQGVMSLRNASNR